MLFTHEPRLSIQVLYVNQWPPDEEGAGHPADEDPNLEGDDQQSEERPDLDRQVRLLLRRLGRGPRSGFEGLRAQGRGGHGFSSALWQPCKESTDSNCCRQCVWR